MARHFQPDDRHAITDPYLDANRWAETLKKTRINDLFLTHGGLDGHVAQVQQEISRMISSRNVSNKAEGLTGDQVAPLLTAIESVKSAIVSAAMAATFDFPKFGVDFGSFSGPLYVGRQNGKVKRDGKAV